MFRPLINPVPDETEPKLVRLIPVVLLPLLVELEELVDEVLEELEVEVVDEPTPEEIVLTG
jgi:hypothetical protein